MSLLMAERVDRPPSLFGPSPADAGGPERDGLLGGGLTLDDAIVGAWEGLAAQAVVRCLACGGALRPLPADARDVRGRCEDCGTTLA